MSNCRSTGSAKQPTKIGFCHRSTNAPKGVWLIRNDRPSDRNGEWLIRFFLINFEPFHDQASRLNLINYGLESTTVALGALRIRRNERSITIFNLLYFWPGLLGFNYNCSYHPQNILNLSSSINIRPQTASREPYWDLRRTSI
jgi:hypothetical protein